AELSTFARDDTPETPRADVAQIAQRALAMRQYTLARLGVESGFEAQDPPMISRARPRAVLQIVVNLLLNAERALAGRGAGRMAVTTARCGDRIVVTIEDNGPGLAPDVEARLFQPIVGGSDTGLGIGLTVARWLAARDGGTVDYKPSALGGCAFTLALPR